MTGKFGVWRQTSPSTIKPKYKKKCNAYFCCTFQLLYFWWRHTFFSQNVHSSLTYPYIYLYYVINAMNFDSTLNKVDDIFKLKQFNSKLFDDILMATKLKYKYYALSRYTKALLVISTITAFSLNKHLLINDILRDRITNMEFNRWVRVNGKRIIVYLIVQ